MAFLFLFHKYLYPKIYTDDKSQNLKFATVKLNNFLGYTKAAQLDYIGLYLDDNDWKINSTNTLL